MQLEKSSSHKERGFKKEKTQGARGPPSLPECENTPCCLDNFYIWNINLFISAWAWDQEKPEEFWLGIQMAGMLCVTKQMTDDNDTHAD